MLRSESVTPLPWTHCLLSLLLLTGHHDEEPSDHEDIVHQLAPCNAFNWLDWEQMISRLR